jgi:hypothetical protein
MPDATRLKDLETEHNRPENLLAEQVFENALIKDALRYQPKPDPNMELQADPGAGTSAKAPWRGDVMCPWQCRPTDRLDLANEAPARPY